MNQGHRQMHVQRLLHGSGVAALVSSRAKIHMLSAHTAQVLFDLLSCWTMSSSKAIGLYVYAKSECCMCQIVLNT